MFSHIHFAWAHGWLRHRALRGMTGGLTGHLIRRVGTSNPCRLFLETVVVVKIGIPFFIATKENIELVIFNSFLKLFKSLTTGRRKGQHFISCASSCSRATHSWPFVANEDSGGILF